MCGVPINLNTLNNHINVNEFVFYMHVCLCFFVKVVNPDLNTVGLGESLAAGSSQELDEDTDDGQDSDSAELNVNVNVKSGSLVHGGKDLAEQDLIDTPLQEAVNTDDQGQAATDSAGEDNGELVKEPCESNSSASTDGDKETTSHVSLDQKASLHGHDIDTKSVTSETGSSQDTDLPHGVADVSTKKTRQPDKSPEDVELVRDSEEEFVDGTEQGECEDTKGQETGGTKEDLKPAFTGKGDKSTEGDQDDTGDTAGPGVLGHVEDVTGGDLWGDLSSAAGTKTYLKHTHKQESKELVHHFVRESCFSFECVSRRIQAT